MTSSVLFESEVALIFNPDRIVNKVVFLVTFMVDFGYPSLIVISVQCIVLGTVVFLVESWHERRGVNPDNDFPPLAKFWRGLEVGGYWAVITFTSVGYGDKCPRTKFGRLLAGAWAIR